MTKNTYGQFFTELDLCKEIISLTNSNKSIKGKVLEPSFGSGNFINSLKDYEVEIEAVEIDLELFNSFKPLENVKLFNEDFLDFSTNVFYDFIIANPPYIELCYSFYSKEKQIEIKNKYKLLSKGRLNLVHIFLDKCLNLLKDNGVLSILLPSAFLTSPVYKTIREKIFKNFKILNLKENVNFKGVGIKVCLIIIEKAVSEEGVYFYVSKDNYFIIENYKAYQNLKTLKDLQFEVYIGEIVWNQNKDLLSEEKTNNNTLVYSTNIEIDNLDLTPNRNRKQFISNQKIRYENCVIFPRTISKKIKYYFVKNNTNFNFENHVLVITHKNLNLLENFYKKLKDGFYDDCLKGFFNSSNLTKTEFLSLPYIY